MNPTPQTSDNAVGRQHPKYPHEKNNERRPR
jgi:hypothetical protein